MHSHTGLCKFYQESSTQLAAASVLSWCTWTVTHSVCMLHSPCISASHHQHAMHCTVTQPQDCHSPSQLEPHEAHSHHEQQQEKEKKSLCLSPIVTGAFRHNQKQSDEQQQHDGEVQCECRYECPVVLARNETAEEVAGLVGAQATSACWVGSQGICFALGYSTGDICVWGLPGPVQQGTPVLTSTAPCTA